MGQTGGELLDPVRERDEDGQYLRAPVLKTPLLGFADLLKSVP
jgi:hypothetical protein